MRVVILVSSMLIIAEEHGKSGTCSLRNVVDHVPCMLHASSVPVRIHKPTGGVISENTSENDGINPKAVSHQLEQVFEVVIRDVHGSWGRGATHHGEIG